MKKEKAVVVFSGGQDSTTCLFWAIEQFAEVEAA
ncbi:7-cyano-7-deazaguanine synthase, partial [Bacillus cereus]|nr:7-cyano-7-deazaguanine synthase [Bacillus cereus]